MGELSRQKYILLKIKSSNFTDVSIVGFAIEHEMESLIRIGEYGT